jgi:hypothetical protein
MCHLLHKGVIRWGIMVMGVFMLGIAALSFWLGFMVHKGKFEILSLILDNIQSEDAVSKSIKWTFIGLMIFGGFSILIAVLAFLTTIKYHKGWCIPLAICSCLVWLIFGGAFGGIDTAK